MPFHNYDISFRNDPLVQSVFVQDFSEHGDHPPPPGSYFRITDISQTRVTDTGLKRITD